MMKLSDYVFSFLAAHGVKDVFMLSGGGCMHLVDSLGRNPDITYRCCLFEQAVALAACGYSQRSDDVGVGLVTTGPGGTNTVTGVTAAWTDSVPLFMLSGQVKRADISFGVNRTKGFQEIDIVSIVKPITKFAETVMEPTDIRRVLEQAWYTATSGRPGPVWVDIPLDVQAAQIDETALVGFEPPCEPEPDLAHATACILDALRKAQRPVILAGYGVKMSHAEQRFVYLAHRLNIPVLLTWKAMDLLPDDDPVFFGRPGCIGQRGANFIQQNSDFILTIGARLDFGQIGYESAAFARAAFKVINDVDASELAKFDFNVDLPVCCDSGVLIDALSEALNANELAKLPDTGLWRERCAAWKVRYPVLLDAYREVTDGASTYVLMDAISRLSDENTTFAPGNSGACSEVFCQSYRVKVGQRVCMTNSLGSMGTGLPESIGACVAAGRVLGLEECGGDEPSCGGRTVCVNGDGGFQMNIQDLQTVHRLGLDIKYFVLNNGGYGSIVNTQNNYFDGNFVGSEAGSGVTLPPLEKVAETYGLRYLRVESNADIEGAVREAFAFRGPVLCEVLVSKSEKTAPKTGSVVLPNGSMRSAPLEYLLPALPDDEFREQMLIPLYFDEA